MVLVATERIQPELVEPALRAVEPDARAEDLVEEPGIGAVEHRDVDALGRVQLLEVRGQARLVVERQGAAREHADVDVARRVGLALHRRAELHDQLDPASARDHFEDPRVRTRRHGGGLRGPGSPHKASYDVSDGTSDSKRFLSFALR